MKDCDGNLLTVGDRVAVQSPHYKILRVGEVVGFTKRTVRVQQNYLDRHWRNVEPSRLAKVFRQ